MVVHRSPSVSSIMNSNEESTLLNCFICYQKVRRAKMCPYCSKIGCYDCLKLWFDNTKMECPYCRQHVSFANYADCGRFVDQLNIKFNMVDDKSKVKDLCSDHQIQMRYFCETCKVPFCPDCSTFGDGHKGHKIALLSKIYQGQRDRIHQDLGRFDLKEYKKNGTVIQAKFQELTDQKKLKKLLLEGYLKDCLEELEADFREKEGAISNKLETCQEQKELLINLKETILTDLGKYSQNELISHSEEIIQLISSLYNKNIEHGDSYTSYAVSNDMMPEFTCHTFELEQFSSLDYSIIYSQGYMINGIEWRLKIYPKGNGPAKDRCISVFLQMTRAYESKKEYEYKIELVNHDNESASLLREYLSTFDVGECWGYNQFIDLDLLNSGFLLDDKLVFRFYIRPSDYKNQVLDQQNYIKKLEVDVHQLEELIREKNEMVRVPSFGSKLQSLMTGASSRRKEARKQVLVQRELDVPKNKRDEASRGDICQGSDDEE